MRTPSPSSNEGPRIPANARGEDPQRAAYAGDEGRRIPANAEEALEIARTQYAPVWADGTPAPLRVHEFDIGYLVCAQRESLPPVAAQGTRRRPMRNPGGTCVVVSKEDGAVCRVPHRPTANAIALYRKFYRPETL